MRDLICRAAVAVAAAAVLVLEVFVPPAEAAAPTALYVSQGGFDSGVCTSAQPCATVTYALSKAASGATIRVSGTIDDHPVISHPVTITTWRGGPARSPAVLDGTASGAVVTVTGIGVTLNDLTIQNGSGGFAGGIFNEEGTLTVRNSTVTRNAGGNSGGGIGNYGGGTMTIINSTVTKNSDASGAAAGINNTGTMTIIASTIAGNTGLGIYSGQGRVASLGATIVADNTGGNCDGYDAGSLVSAGYNLTNAKTGKYCKFTAATDRVNKNPGLGPLAGNGGPTKTMLPATGGPADDVIPQTTTLRGVTVCPGTDQRGRTRPATNDTRCTIGAVEV
ncbi:MAG: hypothetical protein J2P17_23080 [Mycobacterium sp.]|nr:hypothetical protein [Mycobacterium sp.]